jgi:BirA family biotin operon repressor/biotin-[acetyl-CoA-carboxylase] ligase
MSSPSSADLAQEVVAAALGDRPVRCYPALLSTEAEAMAWARSGGPAGAVVVADYQAAPRGRAGWPWQVRAGHGLGVSVLVRPELPAEREGWPYLPGSLALADALERPDAVLEWPDAVVEKGSGRVLARLAVYGEVGEEGVDWATVTVFVEDAGPPRAPLLATLVTALHHRLGRPADEVLQEYRSGCATLGRAVRARLLPLGPDGPEVVGEAVDVLSDGALVIRTRTGRRAAVPPQNLGVLEAPAAPAQVPPDVLGRPVG